MTALRSFCRHDNLQVVFRCHDNLKIVLPLSLQTSRHFSVVMATLRSFYRCHDNPSSLIVISYIYIAPLYNNKLSIGFVMDYEFSSRSLYRITIYTVCWKDSNSQTSLKRLYHFDHLVVVVTMILPSFRRRCRSRCRNDRHHLHSAPPSERHPGR